MFTIPSYVELRLQVGAMVDNWLMVMIYTIDKNTIKESPVTRTLAFSLSLGLEKNYRLNDKEKKAV